MKAPESYAEFLALPDAEREELVKAMSARSEPKPLHDPRVVDRSQEPLVRLVPIDFMDIYRQTGMKRGTIGFSPAWGWCAYRHSPEDGLADCAMLTPPSMEPGETELRIVNGTHWEFSKPNPSHHAEPRLGGDIVDGVVGNS